MLSELHIRGYHLFVSEAVEPVFEDVSSDFGTLRSATHPFIPGDVIIEPRDHPFTEGGVQSLLLLVERLGSGYWVAGELVTGEPPELHVLPDPWNLPLEYEELDEGFFDPLTVALLHRYRGPRMTLRYDNGFIQGASLDRESMHRVDRVLYDIRMGAAAIRSALYPVRQMALDSGHFPRLRIGVLAFVYRSPQVVFFPLISPVPAGSAGFLSMLYPGRFEERMSVPGFAEAHERVSHDILSRLGLTG